MTIIEEYIEQAPTQQQAALNEMYQLLKNLLPTADEKITYGMPTFYLKENLVHFSGAKHHLGFYPTPSGVSAFQEQLTAYKTSKGAIQFPYSSPLPQELIKEIVNFRLQEVTGK